jgi:beta-N-acetylhexosaminidase
MELIEIIGKVFMIGLPSSEIDDNAKIVLEKVRPGSVILFTRNIRNRTQLIKFISAISNFLGYKPLIAIDQEGGIVTRLTEGFSVSPGAMALAATKNPENAYTAGRILGSEMKSVGIDWNLAPVVDINNNYGNPSIGVRSFSDKNDTVIEYASKFVKGLKESGIITCLKHFPGNGRVVTDPHLDMPILNISRNEIFKTELTPFLAINAPCWMPTHIHVPSIQTSKEPITVSKEVLTDMIRDELKYKGVLVADDLNMGGVSNYYLPEDLALKTLEAGMDMISFCDNMEKQIQVRKFLDKKIIKNENLSKRITEAACRIENLFIQRKEMESLTDKVTEFENNKIIMNSISLQSVHILKNKNNLIPLDRADNIFAAKATRLVLVEDGPKGIPLVVITTGEVLNCEITVYSREISITESDFMLNMAEGKHNIIFTENAHLVPSQVEFIKKLARLSDSLILIALRNPYDKDINGVHNAICSFGYNRNQQNGVLQKLLMNYSTGVK